MLQPAPIWKITVVQPVRLDTKQSVCKLVKLSFGAIAPLWGTIWRSHIALRLLVLTGMLTLGVL